MDEIILSQPQRVAEQRGLYRSLRKMSNIAPDIPELRSVPETARPMLYIAALSAAIRSPGTLAAGLMLFLLAVGIGGVQGVRLFGMIGGIAGAALGAAAAVYIFYRVLLPWRARRGLPALLKRVDPRSFDKLASADDAMTRMVAAYKKREGQAGAGEGEGKPATRR